MPLTEEQQKQVEKVQEAVKARAEAKAALKVKRNALRANVGKTFTNGETEAVVTSFDKDHFADGIRGEVYVVHFGNPNCQYFRNCEKFLAEYQEKGAV